MKLLSRNTDYAVRALCYIAEQKQEIVSATELVKALGIPRPFLRKILQALNRAGILESYKGIGGGFRLARFAGNVNLLELIEAFQGSFRKDSCILKKKACPGKVSCPLRKKICAIEEKVYKELNDITIGSIIRSA